MNLRSHAMAFGLLLCLSGALWAARNLFSSAPDEAEQGFSVPATSEIAPSRNEPAPPAPEIHDILEREKPVAPTPIRAARSPRPTQPRQRTLP
ncbi:MAG: hypothetical protein HC902_14435 [Calothrix sp. SM1_5_4]|nr:hypothetical protein [Calothrix sp. SM1_5_4]